MRALLLLLAACGQSQDDLRNNAAGLLLDQSRFEEARAEFLDLRAGGYAHAALGLGIALRELGDITGSLACLQEVGLSEDLGFTLTAMGRHRDAAGVYGQLLSDDPLTEYNLAAALRDSGEEVEFLFRDVLARSKDRDELCTYALSVIADLCAERGDREQARAIKEQLEDAYDPGNQSQAAESTCRENHLDGDASKKESEEKSLTPSGRRV